MAAKHLRSTSAEAHAGGGSDMAHNQPAMRLDGQDGAGSAEGHSRHGAIADITLLYESGDGRMCLFEDAQGHLVAVRASRLG